VKKLVIEVRVKVKVPIEQAQGFDAAGAIAINPLAGLWGEGLLKCKKGKRLSRSGCLRLDGKRNLK
jgi:hypothetical protein